MTDGRRERHRFYCSKAWLAFRALHLRLSPLCVRCREEAGRLVAATTVDHITPLAAGGEPLAHENCMSLCLSHHALKTRVQEQLGKPRIIKGCDVDGRPLDPQRRQGW